MRKMLFTLIAAAFAAASLTASAADAPKVDAAKAVEVAKNDKPDIDPAHKHDVVSAPAAATPVSSGMPGMPARISMNVTVAKQTQGATFGEKVNQGLHAAGSALSQGSSVVGGALPGGAVISAAAMQSDGMKSGANAGSGAAAVSSVGNLGGSAGGGAAAASYAATGKAAAPPADTTAIVAPTAADADAEKAIGTRASGKASKHDTAKNSVGNIR